MNIAVEWDRIISAWTSKLEGRPGDSRRHDALSEAAPLPSRPRLFCHQTRGARSSEVVRWAMCVAQEAMEQAQVDPRDVATVFASSGRTGVLDQLCTTLAAPTRMISPTLFHQSVHNTAAGYWGIATACQQSSTALSCYDCSFVGGLLEAASCAGLDIGRFCW